MDTTGFDAVATGDKVTVSAETMHGHADDARLDEWELKASRRILANLRHLLYKEPMFELIKDQVEEADRRYKQYVEDSHGQYSGTQVVITAKELTVESYGRYLRSSMGSADGSVASGLKAATDILGGEFEAARDLADRQMFPMHPEHYTTPDYPGVIETMGGIPTRTRVQPISHEEAPDFVAEHFRDDCPIVLVGTAFLDDGTRHCYVLQQYSDTPEGLSADLRIWYPSACPPVYLSEHAEHYSVEFRNGFRMAAAELAKEDRAQEA